jgi:phospholipid-binding lipoprotein MlaA
LAGLLGGCASANRVPNEQDPWEGFNRGVYRFNEELDRFVLKPLAQGYEKVTPDPVNRGISNFFSNLDDILVVVNDLLQGKPDQAVEDFSRFAYNTTFGLLGFIDVATHMDLPKNEEDFGQTFAVWGAPSGPYVVLPLFGPSTVRDATGLAVEWIVDPTRYIFPRERNRRLLTALRIIDKRADLLSAERVFDAAAVDRYSFLRESYLQRRQALIRDGEVVEDDFDESELFEDLGLDDEGADMEQE